MRSNMERCRAMPARSRSSGTWSERERPGSAPPALERAGRSPPSRLPRVRGSARGCSNGRSAGRGGSARDRIQARGCLLHSRASRMTSILGAGGIARGSRASWVEDRRCGPKVDGRRERFAGRASQTLLVAGESGAARLRRSHGGNRITHRRVGECCCGWQAASRFAATLGGRWRLDLRRTPRRPCREARCASRARSSATILSRSTASPQKALPRRVVLFRTAARRSKHSRAATGRSRLVGGS